MLKIDSQTKRAQKISHHPNYLLQHSQGKTPHPKISPISNPLPLPLHIPSLSPSLSHLPNSHQNQNILIPPPHFLQTLPLPPLIIISMSNKAQLLFKLFSPTSPTDTLHIPLVQSLIKCSSQLQLNQLISSQANIPSTSALKEQIKSILFDTDSFFDTISPHQNQDSELEIQQQILQQYQYLQQNIILLQKIEGLFSLKYFKKLELFALISNNRKFLEAKKKEMKFVALDELRLDEILIGLQETLENQRLNITIPTDQLIPGNPNSLQLFYQKIKSQLIFIDIERLMHLIKKSKENQKKITNQDGIVFLGLTGSGKTTTIKALTGCQLVKKRWKGEKWLTTKQDQQELKSFKAYPSSQSVTKCLNTISITTGEDVYNKSTTYLIDTTGFKDTKGATLELSNVYGCIEAIKLLAKARFVVVISGKDHGSRHALFLETLNILNKLFPKYKEVQESVTFILNRYDEDDIETMPAALQNSWNKLQLIDQADLNLKAIFKDLTGKLKSKKAINFDPADKNKSYSLEFLEKILQSTPVTHVQRLISLTYGSETLINIQRQVKIITQSCLYYLKSTELKICKFYFDRICTLRSIFNNKEVPEIINQTIEKIKEEIKLTLSKKVTEVVNNFDYLFVRNNLTEQNVKEYIEEGEKIKKFGVFKGQCDKIEEKIKRIDGTVEEKIKQIQKRIGQNFENFESVPIKTIKTLFILLNLFNKKDTYSELIKLFKEQKEKSLKEYETNVKGREFDKATKNYTKINFIDLIFTEIQHQPQKTHQQREKIDKIIIEELQTAQKPLLQLVYHDFQYLNDTMIDNIKSACTLFTLVQKQPAYLSTLHNQSTVKQTLQKFQTNITKYFQQKLSDIENYIDGKSILNSKAEKKLHSIYKQKQKIIDIPSLGLFISGKFKTIKKKVESLLIKSKSTISLFFKNLKENKIQMISLKSKVVEIDEIALKIQKVVALCDQEQEDQYLVEFQEDIKEYYLLKVKELEQFVLDPIKLQQNSTVRLQALNILVQTILNFDIEGCCSPNKSIKVQKQILKQLTHKDKQPLKSPQNSPVIPPQQKDLSIQNQHKQKQSESFESLLESTPKSSCTNPPSRSILFLKSLPFQQIAKSYSIITNILGTLKQYLKKIISLFQNTPQPLNTSISSIESQNLASSLLIKKKLTIEEIDRCLSSLKQCVKIFSWWRPEDLKLFLELEKEFKSCVGGWNQQKLDTIAKIFEELKSEEKEQNARVLKLNKLLKSVFQTTKYRYFKEIYNNDNWIQNQLSQSYTSLKNTLNDELKKYQSPKSIEEMKNLEKLLTKIKIVQKININQEIDNEKFLDLIKQTQMKSQQCSEKLQKSQQTIDTLLKSQNSLQLITFLKLDLLDQHKKLIRAKIAEIICQKIKVINRSKNIRQELNNENCLSEIQQLTEIKEKLQKSGQQKQFAITIKEIQTLINEILTEVHLYYQNNEQEFAISLSCKSYEECFLKANNILKIEKTFKKYLIQQKMIKQEQYQILNSKIHQEIESCLKKYSLKQNNLNISLHEIIQDYTLIFKNIVFNTKLKQLKQYLSQYLSKKLHDQLSKLKQQKFMTRKKILSLMNQIYLVPDELCKKKNFHREIKQIEKQYNLKKNIINEKIKNESIFFDGNLKESVIEYFQDEDANQEIKKQIREKIKQQYFDRISTVSEKQIGLFVEYCKKYQEKYKVLLVKIKQCSSLVSIFENINTYIQQKIPKHLTQYYLELTQSLIDPKQSKLKKIDELLRNHQKLVMIFQKLVQLFHKNSIFKQSKEKNQIMFENFVCQLIKYYNNIKQQVKNYEQFLKTSFQNYRETEMQKYSRKYAVFTKIRIAQNFIGLIFKDSLKYEKDHELIEIVMDKLNLTKDLFIPKIKQGIEIYITPVINFFTGFSFKDTQKFRIMEKVEIQNEMKKINLLETYLLSNIPNLLRSVGEKPESKVEQISKNWHRMQAEIAEIYKELKEFTQNKESSDTPLQKVRINFQLFQLYAEKSLLRYKGGYQQLQNKLKKTNFFKKKQIETLIVNLAKKCKYIQESIKVKTQQHEIKSKNTKRQITKSENSKIQKINKQFEENKKNKKKPQELLELEVSKDEQINTVRTESIIQINSFNQKEQTKIQDHKKQLEEFLKSQISKIAVLLQSLVEIVFHLFSEEDSLTISTQIIVQVKKQGKRKWLQYLLNSLVESGSMISGIIVFNSRELKQLSQTHFKKNLISMKFQDLIQEIYKINPDINAELKITLTKKYAQAEKNYRTWIDSYSKQKQNARIQIKDKLINEIKSKQNRDSTDKIAKIFALWTIITSTEEDGTIFYNYQPHPMQILTILLLLEPSASQKITNNFAEIQTGQGKSLILAVLSTYFALKEFQVDCVCYSQYLSERDKKSFYKLFSTLNIVSKIRYCTFNELIETFCKYKQTDLRKQCQNILQNYTKQSNLKQIQVESDKTNKILLIDEVDVFFIEQFYGNNYSLSTDISSESIKQLYFRIWNIRKQGRKKMHQTITKSQQYLKIVQEFSYLQSIFANHLHHIIDSAKNYEHQYIVKDNKIMYKDQDNYTDKISYGYKTIFAYLYQHNNSNITTLPPVVSSMNFVICEISYSEIPKMYSNILGVSGTLKNMADYNKKILTQEYKIEHNFIIPSVYLTSNRNDTGYQIIKSEDYVDKIIGNIKQNITRNKPILIFFQTIQKMNIFYKQKAFEPFQILTATLTEKHNSQQRIRKIAQATSEKKITLITKSYLRGTDFIIYESKVIKNQGVHLIGTFICDEKSQEIQILGRVARQGDPGSSIFIINQQEFFYKTKNQLKNIIQSKTEIQDIIDQYYETKISLKLDDLQTQIQQSLKKHQKSIELKKYISQKNITNVLHLIIQQNYLPQTYNQKPIKTILAIDATNSMQHLFPVIKKSLVECFSRVYNILEKNEAECGFEIQIVAYRNYNCKENQLRQTTPFENKPQELINFVQRLEPNGGWGNQALEVVFDHSVHVDDLNQIIVITDAEGNTQQQIQHKRNSVNSGLKLGYWNQTQNFRNQLNLSDLFEQIKMKEVLIHALPVNNKIVAYYQKMCKQTKGKCQLFNPSTKDASHVLTNFISIAILELMEKEGNRGVLVGHYKKTYKC